MFFFTSGYNCTGYNSWCCTDIDECEENSHQCPSNAVCMNTVGSYLCECKSGFMEVEKSCVLFTCPRGKFVEELTCHDCPTNTYNNIDGTTQMFCLSCPGNRVTETGGSTSPSDCKRKY